MVMSPLCAVPPVAACKVVTVSASGAVPEIVTTSSTLSIERETAFDPAGIELGVPTAKLTSSVPNQIHQQLKLIFLHLMKHHHPC